jgi:hypothetical protein
MTIRAGESIFYDFEKDDGTEVATDEGAKWEIRTEGGAEVRSGNGAVVEGVIQIRVTRDDTLGLENGHYIFLVGFENNTTGYFDYIMDEQLVVS